MIQTRPNDYGYRRLMRNTAGRPPGYRQLAILKVAFEFDCQRQPLPTVHRMTELIEYRGHWRDVQDSMLAMAERGWLNATRREKTPRGDSYAAGWYLTEAGRRYAASLRKET